jgi:hypothetical protein
MTLAAFLLKLARRDRLRANRAGEAARKGHMMADGNHRKRNRRLDGSQPEQRSPTTLLPMLIGGLVLIVSGMAIVMAIT